MLTLNSLFAGVYSTYLVVENFDNPADIKTVHLSMEVVALKNARPEAPLVPFFDVLVQGNRYIIRTGHCFSISFCDPLKHP